MSTQMEHILEVIKDLTFKNQELTKQNTQLRQQLEAERQVKHTTEDASAERKSLIDKNAAITH